MYVHFKNLVIGLALAIASGTSFAQLVVPAGGSFDAGTFGGLDLACTGMLVQGSVTVGSSTISRATDVVVDGGNLAGDSGTISLSGTFNNTGAFNAGTGTVAFTDDCVGPAKIVGTSTFTNLSFVSTTGRTLVIPDGTSITVTGTLTLQGTPGAPISIVTASGAPAVINLAPGATVVRSNVILAPGVGIGAPLASNVASIPTLSEYGLMLLSLLLGALAWTRVRPRQLVS